MFLTRKITVGALLLLAVAAALAITIRLHNRSKQSPKIVARIVNVTRGERSWQVETALLNQSSSLFVVTEGQLRFCEHDRWQESENLAVIPGTPGQQVIPPGVCVTNRFEFPLEASHFNIRWPTTHRSGLGIQAAWVCWKRGLRPESHPKLWDLINRLPVNREQKLELTLETSARELEETASGTPNHNSAPSR